MGHTKGHTKRPPLVELEHAYATRALILINGSTLAPCLLATEPAFFAGARFEVRAAHCREAAAVESDVLGDKRASSVLVVNVGWRNV